MQMQGVAVPTETLPGERRGGWDLPEPVVVQVCKKEWV